MINVTTKVVYDSQKTYKDATNESEIQSVGDILIYDTGTHLVMYA